MRFGCGYDCSCCFWESETIHSEKNIIKLFQYKLIKKNSLWLAVDVDSTPLLSESKIEKKKNEHMKILSWLKQSVNIPKK